MADRLLRLPPEVRSVISSQIEEQRAQGVVAIAPIISLVRSGYSFTVHDRELEEAIAEAAISAGLAVNFDHQTQANCDS